MESSGQFLAIVDVLLKGGKADGSADGTQAQQIEQVREEGHVSPVTNIFAHIARFELILNQGNGQGMILLRCGFEQ